MRKKFAFGDIDKETFNVAFEDLDSQRTQLEQELEFVQKDLSNLEGYTSTTIAISCKLAELWKQFDFDLCQKIQKLVFPKGVVWDKEKQIIELLSKAKFLRYFAKYQRVTMMIGLKKKTTFYRCPL